MPLLMAALMTFDDNERTGGHPDSTGAANSEPSAPTAAHDSEETAERPGADRVLSEEARSRVDSIIRSVEELQHRSRMVLADTVHAQNRRILDTLQAALNRRNRAIMDSARALHDQDTAFLADSLRTLLSVPTEQANTGGASGARSSTATETGNVPPPRVLSEFGVRAQRTAVLDSMRDLERSELERTAGEIAVIEHGLGALTRQIEREAASVRRETELRGAGPYLNPRN